MQKVESLSKASLFFCGGKHGGSSAERDDLHANRRAVFPIDNDVGEVGGTGDLYAYRREKAAGDRYRLDRLVDGTGADRLQLDMGPVLDHSGDGARH